MLEQKINPNSLKTIKKMLLSKDRRLKRKTKEILPYRRIYHKTFNEYETSHNQILEILEFYIKALI